MSLTLRPCHRMYPETNRKNSKKLQYSNYTYDVTKTLVSMLNTWEYLWVMLRVYAITSTFRGYFVSPPWLIFTSPILGIGSQAFVDAPLLFDPSMSALPIIAKQNFADIFFYPPKDMHIT